MTADHGKAAGGLWQAGEDGGWPGGEFEMGGAGIRASPKSRKRRSRPSWSNRGRTCFKQPSPEAQRSAGGSRRWKPEPRRPSSMASAGNTSHADRLASAAYVRRGPKHQVGVRDRSSGMMIIALLTTRIVTDDAARRRNHRQLERDIRRTHEQHRA
jgi:hypothetical protein